MTNSETIYPDNGLTERQRDILLALLLERDGLVFERKYWKDQFQRQREEFSLREIEE